MTEIYSGASFEGSNECQILIPVFVSVYICKGNFMKHF